MREDEAKTKWCPFTRCADAGKSLGGFNRWDDHSACAPLPIGSYCIGSACMAWRWKLEGSVTETYSTKEGYCGLAGKP